MSTVIKEITPTLSSLLHDLLGKGIKVNGLKEDKPGFMIYDASSISATTIAELERTAPLFADDWQAIYTDGSGFDAKTGKQNIARIYIGPVTSKTNVKSEDLDSKLASFAKK
jgi:hypothetical protein